MFSTPMIQSVLCLQCFSTMSSMWPWPLTLKINRCCPLVIWSKCTKFDSPSWNGSVCIMSTSFVDRPTERQTPVPYLNKTSRQVQRIKTRCLIAFCGYKKEIHWSCQHAGNNFLNLNLNRSRSQCCITRKVLSQWSCMQPEVPQSPDARLSWAFVVKGFISIISKVKMQEKIQRDWNSMTLTFALTFCMRTPTPTLTLTRTRTPGV